MTVTFALSYELRSIGSLSRDATVTGNTSTIQDAAAAVSTSIAVPGYEVALSIDGERGIRLCLPCRQRPAPLWVMMRS